MSAAVNAATSRPRRPRRSGRSAVKTSSIGAVLERLREEFPEVTVSKIRFLESEGLVSPERTPSGYRRYTEQDIQRLRYILVTQRDNYLPLKVIREQLEAMDSGQVTALLANGDSGPLVSPENFRAPTLTRLTDSDVADGAGVDPTFVAELVSARLLSPDAAGFFTNDDVQIARNVVALEGLGLELRHLRTLRTAARRHADLIGHVVDPTARRTTEGSLARAEETAQQMSALIVSLHASLLKNAVREELDR